MGISNDLYVVDNYQDVVVDSTPQKFKVIDLEALQNDKSKLASTIVKTATLHTVIVGDTFEGEVSYGTECSMDMVQRQIKRVASYTDMNLKVSTFEGWHTTADNVSNYLKNMEIGPDDSVVLYFAMHGSRDQTKESRWPDLNFMDKYFDFGALTHMIEEKHPKFLLSIADSCNSKREIAKGSTVESESDEEFSEDSSSSELDMEKYLNQMKIEGPSFSYSKAHAELDPVFLMEEDKVIERYRSLFKETSGVVMVSSSIPGQASIRDAKSTGGIFTRLFLETLRESAYYETKEISWNSILDLTSKRVQQVSEREHELLSKAVNGGSPQTIQYEIR